MEDTKRCPDCCVEKPLSEFHRCKTLPGGRTRRCAKCTNRYMRKRYNGQLVKRPKDLTNRKCLSCKKIKPLGDFNRDRNSKQGVTTRCKICLSESADHKLRTKLALMKHRCYNKNNMCYQYYGGKGVRICDEWLNDFEAFKRFALANGWSPGLQIHRLDHDGDYSPGNVAFMTAKEHGRLGANRKLEKDQIAEIKGRMLAGDTNREIADAFGITIRNVQYIKTGKRWADVKSYELV